MSWTDEQVDADEWNDEWRSALAAQRDEENVEGPRVAGGFMVLGDPDDARDDYRDDGEGR